MAYKLYLQKDATPSNRRGIILMGAGNDPSNPSTGALADQKGNTLCAIAAAAGYLCAQVAYRDQPPLASTTWNANAMMLATDMHDVAEAIRADEGTGLPRNKIIVGGVSYTTFALMSNLQESDSPLKDIRGYLAGCGSNAADPLYVQVPIFGIACAGNHDMGAGDPLHDVLISHISNTARKADSGYYTDAGCSSHCGGNKDLWAQKMLERVELWIP